MKKLFAAALIVMLICGLAACSGAAGTGNGAHNEIDAISEAEKTVPPSFALEAPNAESDIWTSDSLAAFESLVYYIGSDSEKYYANRYDCETSTDTVLLSSAEKLYYDVSMDTDGTVYVLAASANED